MRISALLTMLAICTAPLPAIAGAKEDFRTADADKDGQLQYEEFRVFIDLRANGGDSQARKVRMLRAYKQAMSKVDEDGNGIVTGDELMHASAAKGNG